MSGRLSTTPVRGRDHDRQHAVDRLFRTAQLVALLTLMTLLLTSCNLTPNAAPRADDAAAAAVDTHAGHGAALAAPTPAGEFSLYDLETAWQDQHGAMVSLGDLGGRPRVIALVYTSCAFACPAILKDMKRIEAELRAQGSGAGFVLVSIDPDRDTPARMREYAESTHLDAADWTLLTGTADGVLELAALLGVRYRRVSATDFEHSNVITLVDARGGIVQRQVGLGAEPHALVQAARRLQRRAGGDRSD
jgi:protein SCO1/2